MMNPKIILSPIDFSDSSLEALDVASDIASRYGSAIVLVHVVPFIPKLPSDVSMLHEGDYERGLIGDAEQRLADLAAKLKEKGITARTTVGLANDAAMEILRNAEHEHADLIVIATHGMTGWRRLAFGSVTDKVVRTADCPVLVLRKSSAAQAEPAAEKSATAAG
jgi:nucleotide-binding universal stress UspA family protein